MYAYPSAYQQAAALQNPIMMGAHLMDPYVAMQSQYMMAQPMSLWPYDANRRSLPGMFGKVNENKASSNQGNQYVEPETDEQKALEGLPPHLVSV